MLEVKTRIQVGVHGKINIFMAHTHLIKSAPGSVWKEVHKSPHKPCLVNTSAIWPPTYTYSIRPIARPWSLKPHIMH